MATLRERWTALQEHPKFLSSDTKKQQQVRDTFFEKNIKTLPGYTPQKEIKFRENLFGKPQVSTLKEAGKGILRGGEGILAGIGDTINWLGDTISSDEKIKPVLGYDKPGSKNVFGQERSRKDKFIYNLGRKVSELGETAGNFWREQAQKGIEAPNPDLFRGSFMQNPSWARGVSIVAEAIPSLGYATAIAFATKNPVLGAGALGLVEGSGQYKEAKEAGRSFEEASLVGGFSAIGNTILENIPLTRFLRGGEGKLTKDIFIGAVQEGGEEVAQSLWSNLLAKIGYDHTRDLTEGMVESFIGGAGSGGILGGITSGRGIKTDKAIREAITKGVTPEEIEQVQEMVKNQIVANGEKIDQVITENAKSVNKSKETLPQSTQEVTVKPGEEIVAPATQGDVETLKQPVLEEKQVKPTPAAPVEPAEPLAATPQAEQSAESVQPITPIVEGKEVINPELDQTIGSLSTQDLEKLIDKRYEEGASQEEINYLETHYEKRVSEDEQNMSEDEQNMSEDASLGTNLEDTLSYSYSQYLKPVKERSGYMKDKDILSNMRANLEHFGNKLGGFKGATDEQILNAAKDAYESKLKLIERRKTSETTKGFDPNNATPEQQISLLRKAKFGTGAFNVGEVYAENVNGRKRPIIVTRKNTDGSIDGYYVGAISPTEKSFGMSPDTLAPGKWLTDKSVGTVELYQPKTQKETVKKAIEEKPRVEESAKEAPKKTFKITKFEVIPTKGGYETPITSETFVDEKGNEVKQEQKLLPTAGDSILRDFVNKLEEKGLTGGVVSKLQYLENLTKKARLSTRDRFKSYLDLKKNKIMARIIKDSGMDEDVLHDLLNSTSYNVIQKELMEKEGLKNQDEPDTLSIEEEKSDAREESTTRAGNSGREPVVESVQSKVEQERHVFASEVGSGIGQADSPGPRESAEERASNSGNYLITDSDQVGVGSPKVKYAQNVAAIKLLKLLEKENRKATPEEQKMLVKYVGWGGLAGVFDRYNDKFSKEYSALKELLTEEEYDAAKASTINAHYTSPAVIKFMWDAVKRIGFKGGKVLEPGMGVGHFFGLRPADIRIAMTGVELDSLTGRMAQQLYQHGDIRVKGYQETDLPKGFFDLAISNVPFANIKPYDPRAKQLGIPEGLSLHDFYFAKSLALTKPGGMVAFITSRFTMDKQDSRLRRFLSQSADLVSAVRLPSTAFKANAGTEVVTDIIFLRKRLATEAPGGPAWTNFKETRVSNRPFSINEYFVDNPSMVLGNAKLGRGMYGDSEYTLEPISADLTTDLSKAMEFIPQDIIKREADVSEQQHEAQVLKDDTDALIGSFLLKDGKIYQKTEQGLIEQKLSDNAKARMVGMINLRSQAIDVIAKQIQGVSDSNLAAQLKRFNETYDRFVKKHSFLNDSANERLFRADPHAARLSALEIESKDGKTFSKAEIFSKRVYAHRTKPTSAGSSQEALYISMGEYGEPAWDYMESLTGQSQEIMQAELAQKNLIFKDPNGEKWVMVDEYLAGNVKLKLSEARVAAEIEPAYQKNIEALEKVIPEDVAFSKIRVKFGATWIDADVYREFIAEILDVNKNNYGLKLRYSKALGWQIGAEAGSSLKWNENNTAKWGISEYSALDLLEAIAKGTNIVVKKRVGEQTIIDFEATNMAKEKARVLSKKFENWFWEDPVRNEKYTKIYNEKLNTSIERKYNGDHLTFPGLTPGIQFRKPQIDAIWRVVTNLRTMLAHEVGAGKTWIGITAMHEAKRLGMIKKPYLVVPKNTVIQWKMAWNRLYPTDSILVADEDNFNKQNRQRFLATATQGNWDAIIITHSANELVGVTPETQAQFINNELDTLREFLESVTEEEGSRGRTVKQIEKKIIALEEKLKGILDQGAKDTGIKFEEIGFDSIFIDEADMFKNLKFYTTLQNVKGLGTQGGSERSLDMLMKIREVQKKNGKIVFATGTPVSNSIVETYTMMRYLQPELLEEQGMTQFDSWRQTFTEADEQLEIDASGRFKVQTRLSKFINLPELVKMLREVWDIQTAEMLEKAKVLVKGVNLPFIKGGKPAPVITEMSKSLEAYMEEIGERAEKVKGKKPEVGADNILVILNDGILASLDMRLVKPSSPADPNSKVEIATSKIIDIWQQTKNNKSTQLVFLDRVSPYSDKFSFIPQRYMKKRLIEAGIPEEEIAFIHDYDTDDKKDELYKAVNSGEIRILFGSTGMMGAGTNVQERLVALHHLDIPMRPRDITQREGRIVRQGNTNKEVEIYRYSTKGGLDPFMWQMLEAKSKMIDMLLAGDPSIREIEEDFNEYALIKAATVSNPLIREAVEIKHSLATLQALKNSFLEAKMTATKKIVSIPKDIELYKGLIEKAKAIISKRGAKPIKETFSIEIDGKVFKDKESAWKALTAKKLTMTGSPMLAKYVGLSLKIAPGTDKIVTEDTFSSVMSDSAIGTFAALDHVIFNEFERSLVAYQETIPRLEKNLAVNKELAANTFEREEEFNNKTKRLSEVITLLNEEQKKKPDEPPAEDIIEMNMGIPLIPTKREQIVNDKIETGEVPFLDPEVEKRFKGAYGIHPDSIKSKMRDFFTATWSLRKVFPHLPDTKDFVFIKNLLSIQQHAKAVAQDTAMRNIDEITTGFGPKKLYLFSQKVVLDDLWQEAKAGRALPFGYSSYGPDGLITNTAMLEMDLANITSRVELNPDIKSAIEKRNEIMGQIQKDLVKYGILSEEQLKENYYRHQVLEYAQAKARATQGVGKKLRTPSPGYARARHGSANLDINTKYIEADFEVMAQALHDIATAKNIDAIRNSEFNIKSALKKQAKAQNDNQVARLELEDPAFAKAMQTFRQKMAYSFSQLENQGYAFEQGKEGAFEELARIAEDKELSDAITIPARTILKAVVDRRSLVKGTLGNKYVEWQDIIPESYVTWQPKEGRVFFSAYSVPQRIINDILDNAVTGIDKDDLRKLLAVGPAREQFVIKEELAAQLDELYTAPMPGFIKQLGKGLTTTWKKWVLFNPRRAFMYNFQNFLGDADAVIAGDPGIFKKFGQANQELIDMFYKGKPMTPDMREFFERGGISTGLTLQELPDLKKMEIFNRFKSDAEKAFTPKQIGNIFSGYWNKVTEFTIYRESILRYAAFLHYKEQFGKGVVKYGGSRKIDIDGLKDPVDKAARVATELLGDYSNISAIGKELRESVVPFYSWMEVNMKRYVQLSKNAFDEGFAEGLKTTSRMAASGATRASIMGTLFLMKWLVRAGAMTALVALWNHLKFPEEEEELSAYDQNRMHITLGRLPDGRPIIRRGQGAFADVMEWFGLDRVPALWKDYWDGKISLVDIFGKIPLVTGKIGLYPFALKTIRGINPFYKLGFETLTGKAVPVFDEYSGRIEDKTRNWLRAFSAEHEYDWITRKPSRGYLKSIMEIFYTATDPEENAFRFIQGEKHRFLELRRGRGGSGDYYSPRSVVYRQYKKALAFKDEAAAMRALTELKKLGVTPQDLDKSVKTQDPLFGLKEEDKNEFVYDFLNQRERMVLLRRAYDYYHKTFGR